MKSKSITILLFLTILTTTIVPMTAAVFLLDQTLETSLNLGFNVNILRALDNSSANLKTLKQVDANKEHEYRTQFEEIENLKFIYSKPELVKKGILDSLKVYFGIGFLLAVLTSIVIAIALSRKIAASYRQTYEALTHSQQRGRYLEEIASWQELAKMLAHEIKNPLTPIEILMSSLSRSYDRLDAGEFKAYLEKSATMIHEEVGHLKSIVEKFSEFAKVPAVHLADESLVEVLGRNVRALSDQFEAAEFEYRHSKSSPPPIVRLDAPLFRQLLTNIVKNGIEANSPKKVIFTIELADRIDGKIEISIRNNGAPISDQIGKRIFEPYVSSKSGKDNMGLGLAIARKIMIEHEGEIEYQTVGGFPVFNIILPKKS